MPTCISAPGKVLLAGGYLVLDRTYTGLVFGLSARIHVVVRDVEGQSSGEPPKIIVRSPQFQEAEWTYGYLSTESKGGIEVAQLPSASVHATSRNPFVETALVYALTYVSLVIPIVSIRPTTITILADNDYYSQPSQELKSPTALAQHFLDFKVRLQDAHKTGLGSSAALVTALTGAVLSHYLPRSQFDISSDEGYEKLHNLAQAAHCAAQGKVGSGFDVAAAVYGTCIYRRFSPSVLADLGEPTSLDFPARLRGIVDNTDVQHKWDTEIQKGAVNIPNGMMLVMCDVDCGSQTVGMVKKVLEWRKQNPAGAKLLWDSLQAENTALAEKLLSGTPEELAQTLSTIRSYIREMSTSSKVPIEPAEQTALLNAITNAVPGVYGGVVPGAGGYDAIVLLAKDDDETLSKITSFVSDWSSQNANNVKLLSVKGEMEGVRTENNVDLYKAWIN